MNHYSQWNRGQTPTLNPRNTVPASKVRPHLLELRKLRKWRALAEMIGCSERTLMTLARPDSKQVGVKIAEAILTEAGIDLDVLDEEPQPKISWPEVAEYAKTPEGQEFIEQCRTLRTEEAA
ncbi:MULTISPECIES: hypothetical protein [Brevibacterium]|nr:MULTISPECIES: hypothetical protein [Brevibacterium]